MWKIRAAVIIFFIISAAVFINYNFHYYTTRDTMPPEITLGSEDIRISVKDDEEKILAGCTAWDAVDGDVTGSLGVENLSDFTEVPVREASIVAFDEAGHVARTSRRVTYTDYKPIEFSLDEPLRFPITYGVPDILSRVHATDCLDGDISSLIAFDDESQINVTSPGTYLTRLLVTNSAGDTGELPVKVYIYDWSEIGGAPNIILTDYLIYVRKGSSEIDPLKYIDHVEYRSAEYALTEERGTFAINTEGWDNSSIKALNKEAKENPSVNTEKFEITDGVNYDIPGVYEITYELEDLDHNRGTVPLVVVVRE